jgi:hypothetical protein
VHLVDQFVALHVGRKDLLVAPFDLHIPMAVKRLKEKPMPRVLRDRQQFFYRQIRLGDFIFGHCYILAKLALADSVTAAKRRTGDIPKVSQYFAYRSRNSCRFTSTECRDLFRCRLSDVRGTTQDMKERMNTATESLI